MKPELSIVVLSWNTKNILKNCLESIGKEAKGPSLEVIVIDNASTDGSAEYLKNLKPRLLNLTPVFNKDNLGFAKGNNQGIKKAKADYILLLNSDTVVKKGALKKLVDYLKENPSVAAVSPILLNPNGSKQVNYYMKFPNSWQLFFYHNALLRPLVMRTPLKNLIVSKFYNGKNPFPVEQLPGAALMSRKLVFEKAGSLDESFPFLFEDADWSYRVQKQGLGKLMVIPQAKVVHIGGASWKKHLEKDRFAFYHHYFKSFFLFVKKHYPEKLFSYQLAARITFFINALAHLLTLNFAKSLVQLKLVFTKF